MIPQMFNKYLALIILLLTFTSATIYAQSPIGNWKTVDDKTGAIKSIIEIVDNNGKLHAKVVKLFLDPSENQDPVCEVCKGKKKNQKVIGMEIMWNMTKEKDNYWEGGKIMDPENGKTYGCKLSLKSADLIEVRGFLGFSLLGRNQQWHRVMPD